MSATVTHWVPGSACCDEVWERAYARFETPTEEIAKFRTRAHRLGIDQWPRNAQLVDLFCGRGNGLRALEELGFTRLEGVDLSPSLLEQYTGPAKLYVGDCRELSLPDASRDAFIVQGGLHHLPTLPDDLNAVLGEVRRVLRPDGKFALVEPWLTPLLRGVHLACESPLRRVFEKLDALSSMIDRERTTYEAWLGQPSLVLSCLERHFEPLIVRKRFGKLEFVGRPRPIGAASA
jgi:SAM-dependent methyltransferase